jgi:hypothetical protein
VARARAPASLVIRGEVARTLLDLTAATRADRLRIGRDLLARAAEMALALKASDGSPGNGKAPPRGRGRRPTDAASAGTANVPGAAGPADAPTELETEAGSGPAVRIPAAERRAAALALVAVWRDLVRDLALVGMGEPGDVRQVDLLDDLEAAAARLPAAFAPAQLRRLDVAGERLEGNVSPELVVDALALGWAA